jgi:DNA-binding transcriptional regulator YiaG
MKTQFEQIRNRLGMTQARFSNAFGFSLDAIKHWEGGRRTQKRRLARCSPSSTKIPPPCSPH